MSTYELKWFYDKLVEAKTEEKNAYDNPGSSNNTAAPVDDQLHRENEERLKRIDLFRGSDSINDEYTEY